MGRRRLPNIPTEQEPLKLPSAGRLSSAAPGSGSIRQGLGHPDESIYTTGVDLRGSGPFPVSTPNGQPPSSHTPRHVPLIDQLRYFAEQSKSLSEAEIGPSSSQDVSESRVRSSGGTSAYDDMVVVEAQKVRDWRHQETGMSIPGYTLQSKTGTSTTMASSTPDLRRTAQTRAGRVPDFASSGFLSTGKSGKYGPNNKIPATLARVLLKQELKEALVKRKRQIEACEIEANQREYAVHRMMISGLIPDKAREPDHVPRVVKCSLPPELVAGVKIVKRDPSSDTSQSISQKFTQETELGRNFTSRNRMNLSTTLTSRSAGVQTSSGSVGLSGLDNYDLYQIGMPHQPIPQTRSRKKILPTDPSLKHSMPSRVDMTWNSPSLSLPKTSSDTHLFHPKPMKTAETQTGGVALTRQASPSKYMMAPKVTERNSVSTSSAFHSRYPMLDFGREGPEDEFRISRPRTKSIGTGTSDPNLYESSTYAGNLKKSKKSSRSSAAHRRLMSSYFSDDDDPIAREAKKFQLKQEIARRRQKLASQGDLLDMKLYPAPPSSESVLLRPHALASDYSSHIPHYGSLPRVDFPSSLNDFPSPSTAPLPPLPPHAKPSLPSALGGSLFNETATSLPPSLYPPNAATLGNAPTTGVGAPPIPVSGAGHPYDPNYPNTLLHSGHFSKGSRLADGFLPPGLRSQHSDLGRAFLEAKEEFEQRKRFLEATRPSTNFNPLHQPPRFPAIGNGFYDFPPEGRQFNSLPRNFDQLSRLSGLPGNAQPNGPSYFIPTLVSTAGPDRPSFPPLGHPIPPGHPLRSGIDQYATLRPHNKLRPMYRSVGADLESYFARGDNYDIYPTVSAQSNWPVAGRDISQRVAYGADPYSSALSRSLPAMTEIDRFYDPLNGYSASESYGAPRSPYTPDYGFKDYSLRDPYRRQPTSSQSSTRWYDSLPTRSGLSSVPYSSAPYSSHNSYSTVDPRFTTAGVAPKSSGPSMLSQYANYLNRDFQNRPSATNDYYPSAGYGGNLYSNPTSNVPTSIGYSSAYAVNQRQFDPAYTTARNRDNMYYQRPLTDDRFHRPASLGGSLEQAGIDYGRDSFRNPYTASAVGRNEASYTGAPNFGYGFSSTPPGYATMGYSLPTASNYGNYAYSNYGNLDPYSQYSAASAPSSYNRSTQSNPSASSSNPYGYYTTRGSRSSNTQQGRYPSDFTGQAYSKGFSSGTQGTYQDEWGRNTMGQLSGYAAGSQRRNPGYYGPTGSSSQMRDYAIDGLSYPGATPYYSSYTDPASAYLAEFDRQTDIF